MNAQAGIMDRLRSGTAELHKQAESRPLQKQLGAGTLPRAAFAAYMGQLLLVHDCLESCLDAQLERGGHAAFAVAWQSLARHSENLRQDLVALGLEPHAVAPLPATAALLDELGRWSDTGDLALIGALYVLEGSMNGNRFIAKALQRAWGVETANGLSYLDPYGEEQRPTWAAFRSRVNAVSFSEDEASAILAGADRMFQAIGEISDEQHTAISL
ncbi:MAG: biliverdin-producing heme oxygenase [Phycisphaerales bacterium]|nr:biliverdin-producing heme oxygenase [Phycisphaerales bacterium]